jgi:hypothetical protein
MLSLVSCRLGVAFVSGAMRWRCPKDVVLLPVTDLNLPVPFALIWRKHNASPAHRRRLRSESTDLPPGILATASRCVRVCSSYGSIGDRATVSITG